MDKDDGHTNSKALDVKSQPKAAKPKGPDLATLAKRSSLQEAWAETVASGASAGKNWVTVGAMAYNADFLTSAELERQRQAKQAADEKTIQKYVAFLTLQGEARAIEAQLTSTGKGFSDLKAAEAATLVRYEYAACDAKGASNVSSKGACIGYLDGLPAGAFSSALEIPARRCLKG